MIAEQLGFDSDRDERLIWARPEQERGKPKDYRVRVRIEVLP